MKALDIHAISFCLLNVSKCFVDVFLANRMKLNSNKTYKNKKNRVIKEQTVDLNQLRVYKKSTSPYYKRHRRDG